MLTLLDFLVLLLSIFVSLSAAYVVVALDHAAHRGALPRGRLVQRLRPWFTLIAVAFLLLFLQQFVRVLPPTALAATVDQVATLGFFALVAVVAVDAVRLVSAAAESPPS